MNEFDAIRRRYAEEIRIKANLRSEALVTAFANVSREHFLGPGPWQIINPANRKFPVTEVADPRHLYQDVLAAIDPARDLNNGQPSYLAFCLDSLDLHPGDSVLHVGCGLGYYTAIMAEVVGPAGRVMGVEIDPDLASRASENLAHLPQVEVVHTDGGGDDLGPWDAILINAGATHPRAVWLESLRPGGRLILFLTAAVDDSGMGRGGALKVKREGQGYTARFISSVSVFHCLGCRDEQSNLRLREAMERGGWRAVRSLRQESHEPNETCWLHGDGFCLSTLLVPMDH